KEGQLNSSISFISLARSPARATRSWSEWTGVDHPLYLTRSGRCMWRLPAPALRAPGSADRSLVGNAYRAGAVLVADDLTLHVTGRWASLADLLPELAARAGQVIAILRGERRAAAVE